MAQPRICSLIKMKAPENNAGFLEVSGTGAPANTANLYQTGCIYKRTDGGAETAIYVNEGTFTSPSWVPLLTTSSEASDLPDIGTLTYGAGKILVADGDSYEEVAVNGNVALTSAGVATVQGAVTGLSKLTVTTAPVSYLLSSLSAGIYGTPLVDTALIDNIAFSANLSTATNKTAADTSTMAAYIGVSNTGATTNNKLQGLLASCSVGFNCYDAYAVQGHTTIGAGGISTQNANAHLTGVSGKAVLTGAVGQGWVTGVLAIVEGAGAVTGLCHVIAGQLEATATDSVCDALLFLGADALATAAIEINDTAHVTNFLKLQAASGCVVTNALVPSTAPTAETAGAAKALVVDIGGTQYYIALYDTLHT